MRKEDCREGMPVVFGRRNGEKTRGIVRKLNDKKAKVVTAEARGTAGRSQAGAEWGVPYSMMEPDPQGASTPAVPTVKRPAQPKLEFNIFQDASDCHILQAIECVYGDLSPENLTCDGELSSSKVRVRYTELQRKLRALFTAFGRDVSEQEVDEWSRQREADLKKRQTNASVSHH